MRLAGVSRAVLGGQVQRELRPLLVSIGFNFAALTAYMIFFGPWILAAGRAGTGFVSAAFAVAGVAAAGGSMLGGVLTDRLGTFPIMLAGGLIQLLGTALLLVPAGTTVAALSLVAVSAGQPVRGVAQRAALAETAGSSQRSQAAFAGYRLAVNLGMVGGPLIGAALVTGNWWLLHAGTAVVFGVSFVIAPGRRPIPAGLRPPQDDDTPQDDDAAQNDARPGGPSAPADRAGTGAGTAKAPLTAVFTDVRLYLLIGAATAAWTVIDAYETLLPIYLINYRHWRPQQWGCVYAAGPVLVILFQLRMHRWLARYGLRSRLAGGLLVMGTALLMLGFVPARLALVAPLAFLFLAGDLVWGPASEHVAATEEIPGRRGLRLGLVTSSIWVGSAVAPAAGLAIITRIGAQAVWPVAGACAVLAAGLYVLAAGTPASTHRREVAVSTL